MFFDLKTPASCIVFFLLFQNTVFRNSA